MSDGPPTARDYDGVHRVDAVCSRCDHWRQLDLSALVAADRGNVPLIELPLRCAMCGAKGHKIIVSGNSYELGAERQPDQA
jgi:hypothetical protein